MALGNPKTSFPPKNVKGVQRNKSPPFKLQHNGSTHLRYSRIHHKTAQQKRLRRSSFQESKEQPSTPTIKGLYRNTISPLCLNRESRGHCSSPGSDILPSNLTNQNWCHYYSSFFCKNPLLSILLGFSSLVSPFSPALLLNPPFRIPSPSLLSWSSVAQWLNSIIFPQLLAQSISH